MKAKKINIIFSIVYTIFAIISSLFLIPELIKGILEYGLLEDTVLYIFILLIAMFIGIITSFLGSIIQIVGGFILAGIAGLGTIVMGFLCLVEVLFKGYTEQALTLIFFIVLVGFAIGKIILGFICFSESRRKQRNI